MVMLLWICFSLTRMITDTSMLLVTAKIRYIIPFCLRFRAKSDFCPGGFRAYS